MPRRARHVLACAAVVLASVQVPTAGARAASDPFEAVNRRIYGFNRAIQARVLDPLAERYLSATTPGVRRGVANVLANLDHGKDSHAILTHRPEHES